MTAVRRLHRTTVVVHLLSGVSLRGVLRHIHRDGIVLTQVSHLDAKTDLEGEVVVPKDRIDFYQTVIQ